ncbi:MAG: CopM family metallochaperone [Beijerinckiaceae bacterium]
MKKMLLAAALVLAVPAAALAQAANPHAGHHMPGHAMPAQTDASPSTKAFEAANEKMHKDMAIKFSGDADVDFVKGMIPHHQGAIDMAKVVLAHGKDAQIRKLAEEIIKAQEIEIAMMRDWLKKKGVQ